MSRFAFQRISFQDISLPEFNEAKGKPWITYGSDNLYPEYLLRLFQKSPKHNAIVTQKASFVSGANTKIISTDTSLNARAEKHLKKINRYESMETLKMKLALDLELFDGFAIEVIWNKTKTAIAEMFHVEFSKIRTNADCSEFYYAEEWKNVKKDEVKLMYPFNATTREGRQLYYYKNYNPTGGVYPIPNYVGSLRYIDIDTEIANFHYNNIKNGFSNGTLIQLFKGVPTPEEMRITERRFKGKATGTDNAGGILIQYNDAAEKESIISNIQPSDLDKQFLELNNQVQEEIFVGHKVTSPMLFGIRVEGQLGGRNEMLEAYEIFQKSYVLPRQSKLDACISELFEYVVPVDLVTENESPISIDYVNLFQLGIIDKNEAREAMGLPVIEDTLDEKSNENENGTFSEKENPFGWDDEKDLLLFSAFGFPKTMAERLRFEFNEDLELKVLQSLKTNKGVTTAELANILKVDAVEIGTAINNLKEQKKVKAYSDGLEITKNGIDTLKGSSISTEIEILYSYEESPNAAPLKTESRQFCTKMLEMDKLYTREEIEKISMVLYKDSTSAWKRRGGFYTNPQTGITTPFCRHIWQSGLYRRKLK
jgi:hypothetical protein